MLYVYNYHKNKVCGKVMYKQIWDFPFTRICAFPCNQVRYNRSLTMVFTRVTDYLLYLLIVLYKEAIDLSS